MTTTHPEAENWSPAEPRGRQNEDAMRDYSLPAIVRGFIAINSGPATETMAIREAGFMPRLYGTHEGERVRVVMVSRMGDIGISRDDKEHGYFKRCSIYDLTDFSEEMHPVAPAARPFVKLYAIADAQGFWVKPHDVGGGRDAFIACSAPVLYTEKAHAAKVIRRVDPHALKGYRVIPLLLSKGAE